MTISNGHRLLFIGLDPSRIEVALEWNEVKKALDQVKGCSSRPHFTASIVEIADEIATYKPTILHVAGHGDDRTLSAIDQRGERRAIGAAQLRGILVSHRLHPALIFLNACESESVAIEMQQAADSLVCHPGRVSDVYAKSFSTAFYKSLARGARVKDACEQAAATNLDLLRGRNPPNLLPPDAEHGPLFATDEPASPIPRAGRAASDRRKPVPSRKAGGVHPERRHGETRPADDSVPAAQGESDRRADGGAINTAPVLECFREALRSLHQCARDSRALADPTYDFLRGPHIQNLVVADVPPPPGWLYDHDRHDLRFLFSQGLLAAFERYWSAHNTPLSNRLALCRLFLIHEFFHIGQGVSSESLVYSRGTPILFQNLDYDADARAADALVRLDQASGASWKEALVRYLALLIEGSDMFSYLEGEGTASRAESRTLDTERFHRNLVWLFQYARARSFAPGAGLESFRLMERVEVEVLIRPHRANRRNLREAKAVRRADIAPPLELHFEFQGRRVVFKAIPPEVAASLAKAVFESSFGDAVQAFRPLWDESPDLIGEAPGGVSAGHLSPVSPRRGSPLVGGSGPAATPAPMSMLDLERAARVLIDFANLYTDAEARTRFDKDVLGLPPQNYGAMTPDDYAKAVLNRVRSLQANPLRQHAVDALIDRCHRNGAGLENIEALRRFFR